MAIDDPQDQAEALDDDRLNEEFPPEEPLGVEDYGVTEAEERYREPLVERLLREEPDLGEATAGAEESVVLIDPTPSGGLGDVGGISEDGRAAADAVELGIGAFDEDDPMAADPTTRDVVTEREAPLPAEEAAVHIIEG